MNLKIIKHPTACKLLEFRHKYRSEPLFLTTTIYEHDYAV